MALYAVALQPRILTNQKLCQLCKNIIKKPHCYQQSCTCTVEITFRATAAAAAVAVVAAFLGVKSVTELSCVAMCSGAHVSRQKQRAKQTKRSRHTYARAHMLHHTHTHILCTRSFFLFIHQCVIIIVLIMAHKHLKRIGSKNE